MSSRVWQEKLLLASKNLVRPQTYTQGDRNTIVSDMNIVHRERYNITVPDITFTLDKHSNDKYAIAADGKTRKLLY